jgi:hypothetical protein
MSTGYVLGHLDLVFKGQVARKVHVKMPHTFTSAIVFVFACSLALFSVCAKPCFTFTVGSSPFFYEVKPDSDSSERLSKLECCVP